MRISFWPGTMTDRRAAEAVGIDAARAPYVKAKPKVKEYMASHRASVRAGLVQHEVNTLTVYIGREQILAKYWEFANIDPKLTGYNTSGQSKALDSLWNALGYADSDPKKPDEGEGDSKPNIYVAKWMRKTGDPGYEDEDEIQNRHDEGETAQTSHSPRASVAPARIEHQSRLNNLGSNGGQFLKRRLCTQADGSHNARLIQQNRRTERLGMPLGAAGIVRAGYGACTHAPVGVRCVGC